MSSFRLILSLVVVVLLAVFVGAPFYFAPDTVQGSLPDAPKPPPSTASAVLTAPAAPSMRLGSKVILLQPVIFPIRQGHAVGHVRAQKGITVDLLDDDGANVIVRLVNSSVRIPRTAVAATELLLEDATADIGVVQNARVASRRILDYWFSGSTRNAVVAAP